MSIVGTRPPLIGEVSEYELHHRARLAIKPGITGMWQVSGRSDITDFEEVVELDKEYIENWNIYSVYNMVMSGINGVMSVFSTGVSAGFGELIVKKDKTAFQKAYSDFEYLYYFMVSVIYSITLVTILPFVGVYTSGVDDIQYTNLSYVFLLVCV